MSNYTPGPWILDKQAGGWALLSNGTDITTETFDCTDADARLIASSPELFQALSRLIDAAVSVYDGRTSDFPQLADAAERACGVLAKAEGRSE